MSIRPGHGVEVPALTAWVARARGAAEAMRCRIDFKYALGLELDDPGFHHSVLGDFRDRLWRTDGRCGT